MQRRLVIVPAYNEAENIFAVTSAARAELPGYDVLVVDDGSTDDTAARVAPGVTVVRLPHNLGIGGAVQTGYRYAAMHGYDVAIQVDGDGQHPPREVPKLVERLEQGGCALVVGSRFLEPSGYRQTVARATGSKLLGALLRALTGQRFTDCTSGMRAADRRALSAFARWYPTDYPEPESLLLLVRYGLPVGEVAVTMEPRRGGQSSIGLTKGFFYVLKVAIALLLGLLRDPWPHIARRAVSAPPVPSAREPVAGASPLKTE